MRSTINRGEVPCTCLISSTPRSNDYGGKQVMFMHDCAQCGLFVISLDLFNEYDDTNFLIVCSCIVV